LPDLRRADADRALLVFESAFALAMPSRCRSSMISRSQVATPARIVSKSLLVELRVSSRLPPHRQDYEADAALRRIRLDGHQLGRTARQPVRLRGSEHVAFGQDMEPLAGWPMTPRRGGYRVN
jgi:hypothetical protein